LDVDGEQGLVAIQELRKYGYELPPTLTVKRGRGCHFYFRYPEDALIRNSAGKLGPGLDIRGDGGYVLVPPSVHPSGADYQWMHEVAVAPAPDWLVERLKAHSPSTSAPGSNGNNAITEGQRNASLASLAGTMRRCGMSPGAVQAGLLVENTERCKPPLPEWEVQAIARSVARYEPAAPALACCDATATSPHWPDPLNPAALYGLAGEIVRALEPHTEADPAAVLLQTLLAYENVIGSSAHWWAEDTRHALNLFAVLVGATSKARKGTSWNRIRNLFIDSIDPAWARDRVQHGLSSGEGLVAAVRDGVEDEDPGITDKRLLVIEQEFSSALRVMEREGNTLSERIRDAWDSGDLRTMVKNNPAVATGAHISVIGHITSHEVRRRFSETDITNGFGNRFLWLCVRRSKLLPEGSHIPNDLLGTLVERLHPAVQFGRAAGQISRDEGAREIWCQVCGELSEGEVGLLGAVTARAEAQVMRLACIYALLDQSIFIRPEHLKAALSEWEYSRASAKFLFGDAVGDPVADRILTGLRQSGPMTRTGISNLFGRNLVAASLDRALGVLVEYGLARGHAGGPGGREVWSVTNTKSTN
jgi:hypothetical protein